MSEPKTYQEEKPKGQYRASSDELRAIEEAEQSGVATDKEVEAAFRSFRRS